MTLDNSKDFERENILVSICRDVAGNMSGVDELQEVLEAAKTDLGEIRAGFDITLSGQSQKVQRACREIVTEINRTFDEYEGILKEINSYFHSFDSSSLLVSANRAAEISETLDRLLFEFRQIGLIALGPSGIPGLNLLISTTQRMLNGDLIYEKLLEQAEREGIYAAQMLQEPEIIAGTPESRARMQAWQAMVDVSEYLCSIAETQDISGLANAAAMLNETVAIFAAIPGNIDPETLSKSPTSSPVANIVINSFLGLKNGTVTPGFANDALGRLWNEMETIKFRFNAITRNPPDSSLVEEESEIVEDVIVAMEEALNEYNTCLETDDYKDVDEINEKLGAMIEQLEESMGIFREIADKESKTPCPRCGHFNIPANRFCEKCSFKMPAFAAEQAAGLDVSDSGQARAGEKQGPVMTENVNRLFEAASSVIEGKITIEEFENEVIRMEELLGVAYHAAGPVPHTKVDKFKQAEKERIAKYDRILQEASDVYVQGLEDFEVGLSFFRQYIAEGSSESIGAGMQLIWQGLGKLQEVHRVTEPFVSGKK
jgi:hypothetical protein